MSTTPSIQPKKAHHSDSDYTQRQGSTLPKQPPKLVPKFTPKSNDQAEADARARAQELNQNLDSVHPLEAAMQKLESFKIAPTSATPEAIKAALAPCKDFGTFIGDANTAFKSRMKLKSDENLVDEISKNPGFFFKDAKLALKKFVNQQDFGPEDWTSIDQKIRKQISEERGTPTKAKNMTEQERVKNLKFYFIALRQHFDEKIAAPGYQHEKEKLANNPLLTDAQRQDLQVVLGKYTAAEVELEPLDPQEHVIGRLLKEVKALEGQPVSIENNPGLRALFMSCQGFGKFLGRFLETHKSKLEGCQGQQAVLRHLFLKPADLYESAKMALSSDIDGLLDADEWRELHKLIKPRFEAEHSDSSYGSSYTEFMKLEDPKIFFECLGEYMDTQVKNADSNHKRSELFGSLLLTQAQRDELVESVVRKQMRLDSVDMSDDQAFENGLTQAFSSFHQLKNLSKPFRDAILSHLVESFTSGTRSREEYETLLNHNQIPNETVFAAAQRAVEQEANGKDALEQFNLYTEWESVLEPQYVQGKLGELQAKANSAKLAAAATPKDLKQLKSEGLEVQARAQELYESARESETNKPAQLLLWKDYLDSTYFDEEKARFIEEADGLEAMKNLKDLNLYQPAELHDKAAELAAAEAGREERVEGKRAIYDKWRHILGKSEYETQVEALEKTSQRETFNVATTAAELKDLLAQGFDQDEVHAKGKELAGQAMGEKGSPGEKIPVLEAWQEVLDPTFYAETHKALTNEKLEEDFASARSFDALKNLKDAGFNDDQIYGRAKEVLEGELNGTPSEQKGLLKKWNDEGLLKADDFTNMRDKIKEERSAEKLDGAATLDDLKMLINRVSEGDLQAKGTELVEANLNGDLDAQLATLDDWKDVLSADFVSTKKAELQSSAFADANEPVALKALLDGGADAEQIHGKAQQLAGQEMHGKTPAQKLDVLDKWQEVVEPNWLDITRQALTKEKLQPEFDEAYANAQSPTERLDAIRRFKDLFESADFNERVAEAQMDIVQNADDLAEILKFASAETLGEDAKNALPDTLKNLVSQDLGFINKLDSDAYDRAKAVASDEVASHVGQQWVDEVLAPFKPVVFDFGAGFSSFQEIIDRFSAMQAQPFDANAHKEPIKSAILALAEKDLSAFYNARDALTQACPIPELKQVLEEVSPQVKRKVEFDALALSVEVYSKLANGQRDDPNMDWPEAYEKEFEPVNLVLKDFYNSLKGKLWEIASGRDARIKEIQDGNWAGNNIHLRRTQATKALLGLFEGHLQDLFDQQEIDAIDQGASDKANSQEPGLNWEDITILNKLRYYIEAANETAFGGKDPLEALRNFA